MTDKDIKHVYIIGSKGIPAKYGGFETFVEKLTEYKKDNRIQYHVACITGNSAKSGITDKHFEHNGAKCFNIDVPDLGPAKAIYYDIAALKYAINLSKENNDIKPIFYVLACRIGPFIGKLKKQIQDLNGQLFVNPDGHEWMRSKWSYPVRRYWKFSEKLMVKHADLLVCDSKNIEKYILEDYKRYDPDTTYIAYGTNLATSKLTNDSYEIRKWFNENSVVIQGYYLIVGRFVPENNFETMIREFMNSNSKKDLIIITTANEIFFNELKRKINFDSDRRIKFVGTVYDQEILKKIRESAYGYLHGHAVGGTNPSLIEALGSTKLNLLLNVGFNREVAEDGALYWSKTNGDLARLIDKADDLQKVDIEELSERSKRRIANNYTWEKISKMYEDQFLK